MYEIYTFPNCEKCHKAIEFFRKKNLTYEEFAATSSDGVVRIRKLMKKHHDYIMRDDKGIIMPLIFSYNGQEEVRIYQGEQGLEELMQHENSKVT